MFADLIKQWRNKTIIFTHSIKMFTQFKYFLALKTFHNQLTIRNDNNLNV